MALTDHGHHIPGTSSKSDFQEEVKDCGGPGNCGDCTRDAVLLLGVPTVNETFPIVIFYQGEEYQLGIARVDDRGFAVMTATNRFLEKALSLIFPAPKPEKKTRKTEMTQKRASSPSKFSRFIDVNNGSNVMAMQCPYDCDLEYFRRLWKKPAINHGDWLVKPATPGKIISHRIVTDEIFQRTFREPY